MTVSTPSAGDVDALPRALTVMEPWASAIIHAGKNIENRPWPIQHRGPLLIHAGRGYDQGAPPALRERFPRVMHGPRGGGKFIGVVHVIDCHPTPQIADDDELFNAPRCTHRCAKWGDPQANWHWELADPRPLVEPLAARGQLSLWRADIATFGVDNLPACPTCRKPYSAAPCGRAHALIRRDPASFAW